MEQAKNELDVAQNRLKTLKDQKQLDESSGYGRRNASLASLGYNRMGFQKDKASGKGRSFASDKDFDIINAKFKQIISSATTAKQAIKDFDAFLADSKYYKTANNGVDTSIANIYETASAKSKQLTEDLKAAAEAVKKADNAFQGKSGAGGAKGAYEKALNSQQSTQEFLGGSIYKQALQEVTDNQNKLTVSASAARQSEAQLDNTIKAVASDTSALSNSISKASEEQTRNADATYKALAAQRSYDNEFERLKYHVKYLLSITNAWRQVRNIITQTYEDVSKLDKAFAEIAMVTNYSVSDMWEQYSNYAQMANKLGQTTESVIQASGLYYQQGLDTAEALKLTEDTMKLATLAGLDFKDATSQMTAALRAFHMEMDQGSHVTDVYAEVAANAAVDVQGLSDAMSATAAIANSSGMAFETTTAMLATMVEATQEAPKNLGTAMKSVLARFSELKKNVDSTESEFEDLDYNKVDKALKTVGINIKDANGQFRDMDGVLLELGSKWDSLSRNAQRYIATIAAGSRQQSRFIALMENHERTMELIEVATDSTGRANEQFAKYADTIEYKVNKIKNSWEELRVTLMNKETYNGILDVLDGALQKMKSMDLKDFGIITVWALTVGKNLVSGLIQSISDGGNKLRGAIASVINKQKYSIELQADIDAAGYWGQHKINKEVNQLKTDSVWAHASTGFISSPLEGYSSEGAYKTQVTELNRLYEERRNLLQQIVQEEQKEVQDATQIEALQSKIAANDQQRREVEGQLNQINTQEALALAQQNAERDAALSKEIRTTAELKQQEAILARQKQLIKTKWVQSFQQALGSAVTTALTMALTGSFSTSEIAKTTFVTSITGAVSAAASGNYILGAVQLGVAGVAKLTEVVANNIEKAREEEKLANDEVYRHKKELEDLKKVQEDYNKNLDLANSKYNEIKESWNDIKEASETYKELSSQGFLDEEEQTQLVEATEKLAELVPELVIGYDDQANAIIDTSENYDVLIEKYQKAEQNAKSLQKQAEATAEALGLVEQYLNTESSKAMLEERKNIADDASNKTWRTNFIGKIRSLNPGMVEDNLTLQSVLSQKNFKNFNDLGDPETWIKSVWKDTSADASAWQQLVIDTLKETTGAKNVSSLNLNSTVNEILGSFDDNDKVWQEFAQKFRENINNSSEALEKLDQEAEASKKELIAKVPSLRQTIIEGIIADLSFQGWDDANLAQYKDFLNNYFTNEKLQDFIEDSLNSGVNKVGDVIDLGIKNYADTFSVSKEDIDKFGSLNEEQIAVLSEFAESLNDLSIKEAWDKYNEALETLNVGGDSAIGKHLSEKILNLEDGIASLAREAQKTLGSTSSHTYNEIYSAFSTMGATTANAMVDSITEKVDSPEARAALTNAAFNLLEQGFDPHAINSAINAIDWSSITIFDKQDILTMLSGSLGDFKLSKADLNTFYEEFSKPFLDTEISSVDYSAMVASAIEKYEKFTKKGTELAQYFESGKKQIALDKKELKQVQKALDNTGASSSAFLKTKNGATIFDIEGAKKWYDAQTSNSQKLQERLNIAKKLGTLSAEEIKDVQTLVNELKEEEGIARSILQIEMGIDNVLTRQTSKISASISAYKTMLSNFYSKGSIDVSSFSSWAQTMLELDSTVDLNKFFYSDSSFNKEAYKTFIDQQIQDLENRKDINEAQRANLLQLKMLRLELNEANTELAKQSLEDNDIVKAQKEVEEAHKKVADALKDIAKAQENVIEKQKELNEQMYGSDNFKSQLDPMYNYSTLNQQYADAASRAKDILDNPNLGDDTKQALQEYIDNSQKQLINYLAQNEVYGAAAQNDLATLYNSLPSKLKDFNDKFGTNYDTNIKQYFKVIDGVLTADIEALNRAALPDEIKNEIAALAESYNTNSGNILKNNEAIKKLLKERQEIHKANLQAEVSIQEKVAEVLKTKYEEQVEDLKDKYDAMKDADDDYLKALQESIDKQRKLRDQENKWEELAQKRKKLSLQQRDTSGINAVSNQKLEKEIQKDEQNLLDESVDNIINNLKELYELQNETRQEELDYQEALKDNTNWIAEANKIVLGLGTAEDFINWMKQNSEDWKEKTAQQIELEEMELTEMFQKHQEYMEEQEQQIVNSLTVTEAEVQRVISETSEALVSESQRSLNEISTKVDEAITSAKTALTDAMDALTEKQNAYNEAIAEEQKKVTELGLAYKDVASSVSDVKDMLDSLNNGDNSTADVSGFADRLMEHHWGSSNSGSSSNNSSSSSNRGGELAEYEKQKGEANLRNSVLDKLETWMMKTDTQYLTNQGQTVRVANDVYKMSRSEVINILKERGYHGYYNDDALYINKNKNAIDQTADHAPAGTYKKFKLGGLVNYTGPAWVDGTPSRPESFLSADDTENIAAFTNVLSSLRELLDFTTYSQNQTISNTSHNNTTIEVNVNVASIASDYDVDSAVERIKQDIADAASYAGSNVILNI